MRILLTTASRHGTTIRVGDEVAGVLRDRGHDVVRSFADEGPVLGPDLGEIDAAVVGGAVYMDSWLTAAVRARGALVQAGIPTYAFSVGMVAPTADPADPRWTAPAGANPGEPVKFGGRVDKSLSSDREQVILGMVHADEGDFTDWDAVRAWAAGVADDLDGVPA